MKNHDFSIKKGPFKDISNPAKVKKNSKLECSGF